MPEFRQSKGKKPQNSESKSTDLGYFISPQNLPELRSFTEGQGERTFHQERQNEKKQQQQKSRESRENFPNIIKIRWTSQKT